MEVKASFEPNILTERKLKEIPNDVLYAVAKETLDMTLSKNYIPFKSGDMNRSSASGGVRTCEGGYYIGSFTDYATRVWNLPQETTNWTNKDSKSKWYAYTLKVHGKTILDTAVNQAWKDKF